VFGVILYGPPASGKDTVTEALAARDESFVLYERLKVGPGRTAGYRMATEQQITAMRSAGDIAWENSRYGARYVIDAPSLRNALESNIPVVHLGQAEAVAAIQAATAPARWLVVELWCPWDVAERRIADRHTGDDEARRRAFAATERLTAPNVSIDTSQNNPAESARTIIRALREQHSAI
jgi:guanylate kinase